MVFEKWKIYIELKMAGLPEIPIMLEISLLGIIPDEIVTIIYYSPDNIETTINTADDLDPTQGPIVFWGDYNTQSFLYAILPIKKGTNVTVKIAGYYDLIFENVNDNIVGDYSLEHQLGRLIVHVRDEFGNEIEDAGIVVLHLADDPVCDPAKGNCFFDFGALHDVIFDNVPAGTWYIWAGGFRGYKAWYGDQCSFYISDSLIEKTIYLREGHGTFQCKQ